MYRLTTFFEFSPQGEGYSAPFPLFLRSILMFFRSIAYFLFTVMVALRRLDPYMPNDMYANILLISSLGALVLGLMEAIFD